MDVLSKLRSTVSNTVSQFSGVLPGNPVTREYEVNNLTCSAGPGLQWKVYKGIKKSTKQEASIFVFEKRLLDNKTKENKEVILETLKHGVTQLTKLRHPQILTVQHPLEESRESLAFATEPVCSSLSNILENFESIPSSPGSQIKDPKLYDIEIKYGLLQVAEGLAFLHNDVKLLHRNICPESILINRQGAWKIFGFDFCLIGNSKQDTQPVWSSGENSYFIPNVIQSNLDYSAPETGFSQPYLSSSSDMFSLGMLIYSIYNNGKPLYRYNDDWAYFLKKTGELKNSNKNQISNIMNVPKGLQDLVKMMLHPTPELRPDAHQFIKVDFFDDIGVKTLNYLDSLFQWDKLQKSQFYKGLPPIIQNFPLRVCLHRVMPCLAKEFGNSNMVPFILPSMLQIAETCSQQEYMDHVFPHLQLAMKMPSPVQILLIFMQKMELLLKQTPPEEVKTDVLPMLYRALECDVLQIQELCLSALPTFSGLIDYSAMKNAVLPRIKRMCINTPHLSVRVNSLVCIGKLLDNLDKWLVLDEILPFLQQIPSREPAVLMGILGIYKITLNHKKLGIPKEVIATKIVPFLMPLTIENGLTLNQFNTLFGVLKDMIGRVESEHRSKIEQLSAISHQTSSLTSPASTSTVEIPCQEDSASDHKPDLKSLFSNLNINMEPGSQFPSSLSLEDKQRLVKQQEALQKFIQQPSIITPEIAPPPIKNQPKDLTDTLLQTNLNEMKWSSSVSSGSRNIYPNVLSSPLPQANANVWSQSAVSSLPIPFPISANPSQRNQSYSTQTSFTQVSTNPYMNLNLSPTVNTSMNSPQPTKMLSKSEINDLLS